MHQTVRCACADPQQFEDPQEGCVRGLIARITAGASFRGCVSGPQELRFSYCNTLNIQSACITDANHTGMILCNARTRWGAYKVPPDP